MKKLILAFWLAFAVPVHAANVDIPALPAASSVGSTDLFECSQAGVSAKCTAAQFQSFATSGFAPLASPTFTGTVTAPDAGTWGSGGINGSIIGGTTPAAGSFTTVTGSGIVKTTSAGSAAAPSLVVGNATTGFHSVSTTGIGLDINGVVKGDWGITTSGVWSFIGNVSSSGNLLANATGLIQWTGRGILSSPAAGGIQFGGLVQASPVAQTLSMQSVIAGTSNGAGQNATIIGSLSTGSGTSGDIIVQTGGTGAATTVQNTAVTALTIKGATQLVVLPQISSDATHTDATVCEDTTTHALYAGSGTLGVCLGTSSVRYKREVVAQKDGLDQIVALDPVNYRYIPGRGDNGAREQYGLLAEDVVKVLPKLVGLDADGKPNSVDLLGMVPVLIKAIQELKADNDSLRRIVEGRFAGFARVQAVQIGDVR